MKKKFFSICLLMIVSFSFAQEDIKSKFGYGFGFGVGNSTLENNQLGVLSGNMLSLRFNIDYSFTDKENTKLISGIEFLDFNANFYNGLNQSKLKNEYLQIPLKISHRVGFGTEEKLNILVGAGMYANFLMRSKISSLEDKTNTKSGGVNFGYSVSFGMEYNLTSDTSIGVYSDVMSEINEIKNNGFEQKQTEILLLNIGISTRF